MNWIQKYFVNMKSEIKLKVALIGESGTGKTSLATRFSKGIFNEKVPKTVVVDSFQKSFVVGGKKVTLNIWDTAGQQCYKVYVQNYIKKADGVVLLYDVTNKASFNRLVTWLRDVRQVNRDSPVLIVGNKMDKSCAKVSSNELKDFSSSEGLAAIEISAKSGENVEKMFQCLVSLMVRGVTERTADMPTEIISGVTSFPGAKFKSVSSEGNRCKLCYKILILMCSCVLAFLFYNYNAYHLLTNAFGPVPKNQLNESLNLIQSIWNQICNTSDMFDKILSSLQMISMNLF